jgi:hypothetical protein
MERVAGAVLLTLGLALILGSKPVADRIAARQAQNTGSPLYAGRGWRVYLTAMLLVFGLMLLYVGYTLATGERPFGATLQPAT